MRRRRRQRFSDRFDLRAWAPFVVLGLGLVACAVVLVTALAEDGDEGEVAAERGAPATAAPGRDARRRTDLALVEPETLRRLDRAAATGQLLGVVRTADGGPLAGALVEVAEREGFLSEGLTARVETDALGRYAVALPRAEGAWVATASAAGHRSATIEVVGPVPGGERVWNPVLDEGMALIGRVVVLDTGLPVPRASVVGYRYDLEGNRSVERETRTDDDGAYRLDHLDAGSKTVVASAYGFADAVVVGLSLDGADGPERRVDFDLLRGKTIRGRVVDDEGEGISGVTVETVPLDRTGFDHAIETGEEGWFEATGLRDVLHAVRATKAGYGATTGPVTVLGGGEPIQIELFRCPLLAGRVVDDETGAAVEQFTLVPSAGEVLLASTFREGLKLRAPDGFFRYRLPTLAADADHVWLFALASGWAGGHVRVPIERGPGILVEDLEIRLLRGGALAGRIVAAGAPVGWALVSAFPVGGEGTAAALDIFQRRTRRSERRSRSSSAGLWRIDQLLPGRYRVRVEHPSYPAVDSDVLVVANRAETPVAELALAPGGEVRGLVRNGRHWGREGVRVVLRPIDPRAIESYVTRSDVHGRYAFEAVAPGRYVLHLAPAGASSGNPLGSGTPVGYEIEVLRGGVIERNL